MTAATSKTPKIFAAIQGVMADLTAIGKGQEFKAGNTSYNFRGIDDVMNALHPLLVKHKVVLSSTTELLESKEREFVDQWNNRKCAHRSVVRTTLHFYAEDGSTLPIPPAGVGEAVDNGDKSASQAASIAYKYAMLQTFCVPTEDMVDGDATVTEFPAQQAPQQAPVAPYDEEKAMAALMEVITTSQTALGGYGPQKNLSPQEFFDVAIAANGGGKDRASIGKIYHGITEKTIDTTTGLVQ